MDSRERTFLALEHQTPDRIPIDFWASKGMIRKLEARLGLSYEEFLEVHDVDLHYLPGPEYVGPALRGRGGGGSVDIWGVPRTIAEVPLADGAEQYAEVTEPPLAHATTVSEVASYHHWPSPDWFRYEVVREQCEEIRRSGRVVVFMGDRLNRVAQLKPAMYLRGVEQILTDMMDRPDLAHAVFQRVRKFYVAYLDRILGAAGGGIDIVLTGDDFGAQTGPLVSPAMWEEYLRPGFADYLELIRSRGVRSMHHTCGSVAALIPRLIECGLDILQSLQPEAAGMSPEALKADFGSRLCFQGGVSIQRTMPFGTPAQIAEEVKRLARVLGAGGGYIFCTSHNLQADTPVRNVQALMASYHEFGRYST